MVAVPKLPEDLGEVLRHVESTYPNEGCGLLLQAPEGSWRTVVMPNVYDKYHAKDPVRFPRTSATAYLFDPKDWMAVSEEAERRGERVACIFHSHAEVGAYFSAEDRVMAAPDGEPLFPDVVYLVVAVDQGKATGAKLFFWSQGDFVEQPAMLSLR
jgi:[CysO sulfur-carrier protein]-S-L-cysteine hydrolase